MDTATAPTTTESGAAAEERGSEAQSTGEDAKSASAGSGQQTQEMARCCLDRGLRHVWWAGRLAPGRYYYQSVYSIFVRVV